MTFNVIWKKFNIKVILWDVRHQIQSHAEVILFPYTDTVNLFKGRKELYKLLALVMLILCMWYLFQSVMLLQLLIFGIRCRQKTLPAIVHPFWCKYLSDALILTFMFVAPFYFSWFAPPTALFSLSLSLSLSLWCVKISQVNIRLLF
jgi:hypothetical protein